MLKAAGFSKPFERTSLSSRRFLKAATCTPYNKGGRSTDGSKWTFTGALRGVVTVASPAGGDGGGGGDDAPPAAVITGAASFWFDTATGDFDVMLDVSYENDELSLGVSVVYKSGINCDVLRGNGVIGRAPQT